MLPIMVSNKQVTSNDVNLYCNQMPNDDAFALGSQHMLPLVTQEQRFSGKRSSSFENPSNLSELVRNFDAMNIERSDSIEDFESVVGNEERQCNMQEPSSSNRFHPSSSRSKTKRIPTVVCKDRVSEKILKLVSTLKNPKRSSTLIDYFRDEDDQILAKVAVHPNAPKPTGGPIQVISGDHLITPSGLPKNLECAVRQYGMVAEKQPAFSCINIKSTIKDSITFSRFEKLSMKLAYYLTEKLVFGPNREFKLKKGERIALLYASNEPIPFITAFYGSLMASLVPIAIEVPSTRRSGSCRSTGFLLSNLDVKVVLTSEQCYRGLHRNPNNNEELPLPGWPTVFWINAEYQTKDVKIPKDWQPPSRLDSMEPLYIEYTYTRDGSIRGVSNTRSSALEHCRALTAACSYTESDVICCVVDNRREAGLWHCVLTSMFNGIHVIFVPHSVMQMNPGAWLTVVTKQQATVAIVRGRDMHWAMLTENVHGNLNLTSLRMLLVVDGANPWTLNTCDAFVRKFRSYGLSEDVICPAAHSSESLTVAMRRPLSRALSLQRIITGATHNMPQSTTNLMPPVSKGVLSMFAMSHSKIQVDTSNELNSLTVTDCGVVLPSTNLVTVRIGSTKPYICRTDEIGEICISNAYCASHYWNLEGASKVKFQVEPLDEQTDLPVSPGRVYTRTGLLGFPGPPIFTPSGTVNSLVFICGNVDGLLSVEGRRHNADDIVATILAIPSNLIFRSRVCVFSVNMLKDERIVVVAELREQCTDAAAFCWMSTVIQTVEHIHQDLSTYCIALVPQNCLPKTPFGGIAVHEVRRLFIEGLLHPSVLLLCPHSSIQNLPQARAVVPTPVGASAMMVGQMVQGSRFAEASGRALNISLSQNTNVSPPDIRILPAILTWRAEHTPNDTLFTVFKPNPRALSFNSGGLSAYGIPATNVPPLISEHVSAGQLYNRVECIKTLLVHRCQIAPRSIVVIMYSPGVEMIAAFYACQFLGHIPVVVRPPVSPSSAAFPNQPLPTQRKEKTPRKSFSEFQSVHDSKSPSVKHEVNFAFCQVLRFVGGCTGVSGTPVQRHRHPADDFNGDSIGGSDQGSSSSLSSSMGNLTKSCLSRANNARFTLESSMETAYSIIQNSRASLILTNTSVMKLLKSKVATSHIPFTKWPKMFDTEDSAVKRKPTQNVSMSSLHNSIAFIDFSISTTGTFTGVEITHSQASVLAHAQKFQCELYPNMKVLLCLEPYSGLGLSLWVMTSIYCGHQSLLVPPQALESAPDLWLVVSQQEMVRDLFLSYAVMEQSLFRLAPHINKLKRREVCMNSLRNVIAIAEERPRVSLIGAFAKVFAALGLNSRAISSSFGCRTNLAICLQGSTNPDLSTVYVDKISLRNDRIKLVEKGSPNSICLQESGKLLPGLYVVIANPDTLGQCSDSQLGEIWISSAHNSQNILGPFQISPIHNEGQNDNGSGYARNSTTTATSSIAGTQSSTASSFEDLRVSVSASSLSSPQTAGVQDNNQELLLPPSGITLNDFGCGDILLARLATGDEYSLKQTYVRSGYLGFVKRTDRMESDGHLHDALFVVGSIEEAVCLRGMRYHPTDIENSVLRAHQKICQSAVFTWSNLLVVVVEMLGEMDHEALDLVHPVTARVLEDHQLIVGVVVVVDPGSIPLSFQGEKLRILLRNLFITDSLNPIYVSYNI